MRHLLRGLAALCALASLSTAALAQGGVPSSVSRQAGGSTSNVSASAIAFPDVSPTGAGHIAGPADPFPVAQPDARATSTLNAATLNATYAVALANGEAVTSFAVSGLTASTATLTIEGSDDGGATWGAINGLSSGTGTLFTTLTADAQFRVNTGGRTNIRLRVSIIGSGTITVASNASTASTLTALSSPIPAGSNNIGTVAEASAWGPLPVTASSTRPANATTYTALTAWANATSGATYLTFTNVCRAVGTQVLISHVTAVDYANQTTKLQGELWLFRAAPTAINDNATFSVAAADMANYVTTVSFTASTVANQASGATGVTVADLPAAGIAATCAATDRNLYGLVKVVNAYVPVSAEVLTLSLKPTGTN